MKLEGYLKTLPLADLKQEARDLNNIIGMKRCYHVGDDKLLRTLMGELLNRGLSIPEIEAFITCEDETNI